MKGSLGYNLSPKNLFLLLSNTMNYIIKIRILLFIYEIFRLKLILKHLLEKLKSCTVGHLIIKLVVVIVRKVIIVPYPKRMLVFV